MEKRMPSLRVSIVADLGESFGNYTIGDDSALLDRVTMANVACGFHAGDPRVMDETVRRCVERSVEIGAHPADLRRTIFRRCQRAPVTQAEERPCLLQRQIRDRPKL